MPEQIQPDLQVKEINDTYLRRNFESLQNYFKNQNQLLDFKFLDVSFTGTENNRKIFHGLGRVPTDLIRLSMTGSGVVTFTRSLFDSNYLFMNCAGKARVRFFAGNYFGAAALGNFDEDATEQWFSQAPAETVAAATTGVGGSLNLPPGGIILWPSPNLPDPATWGNWLWVDGTVKNISDFPDLYAEIGTRYNTGGENSQQFRLPAPMGRIPLIAGVGTSLTTRTLGDTGGEETHLLTSAELPAHTHPVTDPTHAHSYHSLRTDLSVGGGSSATGSSGTGQTTAAASTGISVDANTGGGGSHNVMNPYFVFNAIIKA